MKELKYDYLKIRIRPEGLSSLKASTISTLFEHCENSLNVIKMSEARVEMSPTILEYLKYDYRQYNNEQYD